MRQLILTACVIAGGLSMIIMLTQSLRLFELVLESNASSGVFLTLMGLTFPRFAEAVLPASTLIATLFVFNRLSQDSEMVVLKAAGTSPSQLVRPVIIATSILTAFLLIFSFWLSPLGISNMQQLRKEIRSQYAQLLFREGAFNSVGNNLTAYIQARSPDGRLQGLVLHDTRNIEKTNISNTIIASSGHMIDDDTTQKIIVYDGSRHEKNHLTNAFSRLDFKQYVLEIPVPENQISERWREPDERTISELLNTRAIKKESPRNQHYFKAELHRRLSAPLLMLAFTLTAATSMLLGGFTRAGQLPAIIAGASLAIAIQSLYLLSYNLAKNGNTGCVLIYLVPLIPILLSLFILSPSGQNALFTTSRSWRKWKGRL